MAIIDVNRRALIEGRLGMPAEKLGGKLRGIRDDTLADRESLCKAYRSWHPENDIRIGIFNTLWNLLATAEVSLSLLWELAYDDWWHSKAIDPTKLTTYDKSSQTLGFERFVKHGFSMGIFISVERTLRIFLRAIDPSACGGATAAFKSVYSRLLGPKGLALPIQQRHRFTELLDIMRVVRNLIHNDGVYFDARGADRTLNYSKIPYLFEHGKPVRFVSWNLLLSFVEEARELLMRIVIDPKLSALHQILDPYS